MKTNYFKSTGIGASSLVILCFCTFLLSSCFAGMHGYFSKQVSSYDVALKNRQNLAVLQISMSKDEVLKIFGTETTKPYLGPIINSPYRVETFKDDKDNHLDVLFFYTDEMGDSTSYGISEEELTPIVLKNGKVEGWGRSYLSSISENYNYRIKRSR